MATIDLTHDLATRFMKFIRVSVDDAAGDMNLLCLKSVAPDKDLARATTLHANDGATGVYNDTIALVYRDATGAGHVECFVGTVDPGTLSGATDGTAHLTFGQHLYTKGLHKKKYPALVAAHGINRVWRDPNGNFKPDLGEKVFEGMFGVNVHAGGAADKKIGSWSLGCINICGGYDGPAYERFLDLVNEHTSRRPIVRVNVWRGSELVRFAQKGATFKPSLLIGMKNPWVSELQIALRAKDVSVGVDGDFGGGTQKAVAKFQQLQSLEVDGWCGDETWTALA